MYPFVRLLKERIKFRKSPRLGLFDTHVSHHICWPWDLDFWGELNNGRTLTLYDLGRTVLAQRTGLIETLRAEKWGIAVAGATVRYRKRVLTFQRFEMRTRCIGWDDKFLYMEQSMWRDGDCTSHLLLRGAVTDRNGLVRMDRVGQATDLPDVSPDLPDWVALWDESENLRPWPPMSDATPG